MAIKLTCTMLERPVSLCNQVTRRPSFSEALLPSQEQVRIYAWCPLPNFQWHINHHLNIRPHLQRVSSTHPPHSPRSCSPATTPPHPASPHVRVGTLLSTVSPYVSNSSVSPPSHVKGVRGQKLTANTRLITNAVTNAKAITIGPTRLSKSLPLRSIIIFLLTLIIQ